MKAVWVFDRVGFTAAHRFIHDSVKAKSIYTHEAFADLIENDRLG